MADCTAGAQLLERLPPCRILHGDKGYDTDAIRRQIEATGATPNIPPKANRRRKNCFSPALYRGRNAIERMFCRLKDFRRIATRLGDELSRRRLYRSHRQLLVMSPDPNNDFPSAAAFFEITRGQAEALFSGRKGRGTPQLR